MVKIPSMYSLIYRRLPWIEEQFDYYFTNWTKPRGHSSDDFQDEYLRALTFSMDYGSLSGWAPKLEAQGVVYRRDYVFALNMIGIIDGCPSWLEEVKRIGFHGRYFQFVQD